MSRNCANCREGKKHGITMVYCLHYGIDISGSYDRCGRYKPRIAEVENETHKSSGRKDVGEGARAG